MKGRNEIRFLITAKNPMSKGYRAGLDYMEIK